ncbi:unnamed protein product, partial [Meganyctiphanes norvegica]
MNNTMSIPSRSTTVGNDRHGLIYDARSVRCLMTERLLEPVDTLAMANVNSQVLPILKELTMIQSRINFEHPSYRHLFNLLVAPECAVEVFNYIIGPLQLYTYGIVPKRWYGIVWKYRYGPRGTYVGKLAAEALALRCPVLEGPWETAAWFVVYLNKHFKAPEYGFVSDIFSTWIIQVIGDADICPNPYLRIELIHLLRVMVDINDDNRIPARKSVMSAVASINMPYLFPSCRNNNHDDGCHISFFNMHLEAIISTLKAFSEHDGYPFEFDEKLSDKMQKNLNLQKSIMVQDVVWSHALKSSRYTWPRELHTLISLLNTTNAYINRNYKELQEKGHRHDHSHSLSYISNFVHLLFTTFRNSFQEFQLLDIAALCIMDLVELVLLLNVELRSKGYWYHHDSLKFINDILQTAHVKHGNTPQTLSWANYIITKYNHGRLRKLREKLQATATYNDLLFMRLFPKIDNLLEGSLLDEYERHMLYNSNTG